MILKLQEWQELGSKTWHCMDTSAIGKGSSNWLHIPAGLGMSPSQFVEKLVRDFRPDNLDWYPEKGFLLFSWNTQAPMRKFKNWANAQFRKNNYHY